MKETYDPTSTPKPVVHRTDTAYSYWSWRQMPKYSQNFDIGEGRTLRVWSTRDNQWYGGRPPLLLYRVDSGDRRAVEATILMCANDEGYYDFRMVKADGGRLVCVYEVEFAANSAYFVLIYDVTTGESWPEVYKEGYFHEAAVGWRERFRKLKAENPELPTPKEFE